jgi:hypothetical protein
MLPALRAISLDSSGFIVTSVMRVKCASVTIERVSCRLTFGWLYLCWHEEKGVGVAERMSMQMIRGQIPLIKLTCLCYKEKKNDGWYEQLCQKRGQHKGTRLLTFRGKKKPHHGLISSLQPFCSSTFVLLLIATKEIITYIGLFKNREKMPVLKGENCTAHLWHCRTL